MTVGSLDSDEKEYLLRSLSSEAICKRLDLSVSFPEDSIDRAPRAMGAGATDLRAVKILQLLSVLIVCCCPPGKLS